MLRHARGRILILAAAVATLALVGACGSSEDPTAVPQPTATAIPGATSTPAPTATPEGMPKFGGILVHAIRGDLKQKNDPMFRNAIPESEVQQPLYGPGGLLATCEDDPWSRSCPYLAESFDVNADFTVWTFKLRDNILWHDGVPMTAEDFKFWADLTLNGREDVGRAKSREASNLGNPSSIEVLADNTIRITLNSPIINYPILIGDPGLEMSHPKHLAEPLFAAGEDVAPPDIDYVGAGPFKFLLYDKGSVVSLRRFENYFEEDEFGRQLPYLDGIDFPIISDREAMVAAFRAGRVDTTGRGNRVWFLPEQIETTVREMGDDVYFTPVPSGYRTLSFNTSMDAPWADERVRRAISLVPDFQLASTAIYGEFSTPAALYFPDSPWVTPDYMTWPGKNPATKAADIAEGKRLMAEAGFADGFEVALTCRSGSWEVECEWIAEELRSKLNITMTIDIVDNSTRGDRQCEGTYEAILNGGSSNAKFPESVQAQVGPFAEVSCSSNFYNNDLHVTVLTDRILQAKTFDERVAAARAVEKYVILDKVYGITFFASPYPFATRSYVKGVPNPISNPNSMQDSTRWWIDK